MQDEELYNLVNAYNKAVYAEHKLQETGEVVYTAFQEPAEELRALILSKWSVEEVAGAQRLISAHYKRVRRLKNRVNRILDKYPEPYFVTLTFTDEELKNTSPDTRRQKVRRFLNAHCVEYVANKDFGKKNHREHYHAVVSNLPPEWPHGFKNYEPIIVHPECKNTPKRFEHLTPEERAEAQTREHTARLAKYIAKLTNHAIKETAESSRLIYSRTSYPEVDFTLTREEEIAEIIWLAKRGLLPVLDCSAFGRKSPCARPVSGATGTAPKAEQLSLLLDELSVYRGD